MSQGASDASTPVNDHGELVGLSDDDHAIYTKADGSRAFTGDISFNLNDLVSVGQILAGASATGTRIDLGVGSMEFFDNSNVSRFRITTTTFEIRDDAGSWKFRWNDVNDAIETNAVPIFATDKIGSIYDDTGFYIDFSGNDFSVYKDAVTPVLRMHFDSATNDITFYEADGTTVSAQWDESDSRWEFAAAPYYPNHLIPLTYSISGDLTATNGVHQIPMAFPGTLVYTRCRVSTAPTGTGIVFDVNKGAVASSSGTTVYATSKPTIAATAFDSGNDAPPSTVTFVAGDWFEIDVDSVGSTVAGANAVITLWVRPD